MSTYKVPAQTRIGHVHLKVANLQKSLDFYHGLLGFEIISTFGDEAAFVSAGGYHHHIGLNTFHSKNGPNPSSNATGLYHTAILYPTRKDLAFIYKRLYDAKYPFTGFADHGVSDALYLDDPDGNGVELCWDKARELWPVDTNGNMDIYTKRLNLSSLLAELS